MKISKILLFSFLWLFLFKACDHITPPALDDKDVYFETDLSLLKKQANVVALSKDPVIAADEMKFTMIAKEIPGYGGHFFDEEGHLVVYVTDMRHETAAQSIMQQWVNAIYTGMHDHPVRNPQVHVKKGDYTFKELQKFRDILTFPLFDIEGVIYSSIYFTKNKFRVGIIDEFYRDKVKRFKEEYGVPVDALYIELSKPVELLIESVPEYKPLTSRSVLSNTTLRDYYRPIKGGLRQQRRDTDGSRYNCTISFNADWNDEKTWFTASHCTEWATSVTDGTRFYNPNDSSEDYFIGNERYDRGTHSIFVCGPHRRCRYSDAAIIELPQNVTRRFRGIARTEYSSTGWGISGSLVIDNDNPFFNITYDRPTRAEGMWLNKVGQTTGWTRGRIIDTSRTIRWTGRNVPSKWPYYYLLNQVVVEDMYAAPGDSGSPVFETRESNNVWLHGILWGIHPPGHPDLPETIVYSPMSGVRKDLGDFKTHDYGGGGGGDEPCDPYVIIC